MTHGLFSYFVYTVLTLGHKISAVVLSGVMLPSPITQVLEKVVADSTWMQSIATRYGMF